MHPDQPDLLALLLQFSQKLQEKDGVLAGDERVVWCHSTETLSLERDEAERGVWWRELSASIYPAPTPLPQCAHSGPYESACPLGSTLANVYGLGALGDVRGSCHCPDFVGTC